jgi:hypothetical protein
MSDVKEWVKPAEQFISKNPGASLAAAFAIGVAVAWWIKRR